MVPAYLVGLRWPDSWKGYIHIQIKDSGKKAHELFPRVHRIAALLLSTHRGCSSSGCSDGGGTLALQGHRREGGAVDAGSHGRHRVILRTEDR